jgi:hypothetical protein
MQSLRCLNGGLRKPGIALLEQTPGGLPQLIGLSH